MSRNLSMRTLRWMTRSSAFRAGLRAGAPFAVAGFLLSLSFGVLARDAGMPVAAVIVMSVIVFAGRPSSRRSRSSPPAVGWEPRWLPRR